MNVSDFFRTENVTSIIALTAIISPVLVSVINGFFKIIFRSMKYHHESKMQKWNKYYSDCSNVFSELLTSSGKLLANSTSDTEILNTLAYLYKSFSYADKPLSSVLSIYHQKLDAWNNDIDNQVLLNDIQEYTVTLSLEIHRFLLENIAGKHTIFRKLHK